MDRSHCLNVFTVLTCLSHSFNPLILSNEMWQTCTQHGVSKCRNDNSSIIAVSFHFSFDAGIQVVFSIKLRIDFDPFVLQSFQFCSKFVVLLAIDSFHYGTLLAKSITFELNYEHFHFAMVSLSMLIFWRNLRGTHLREFDFWKFSFEFSEFRVCFG